MSAYLFVIICALVLFLLCALLFPVKNKNPKGYCELFYLRRAWFFGVLALVFAACLLAIASGNRWYHGAFAVIGMLFHFSRLCLE